MKIKMRRYGYSALVNNHKYYGIDIHVGDRVDPYSNLDRHIGYKGTKGIVRKIYYHRFQGYERWYEYCYLQLFLPNYDKTLWFEADCCDFSLRR